MCWYQGPALGLGGGPSIRVGAQSQKDQPPHIPGSCVWRAGRSPPPGRRWPSTTPDPGCWVGSNISERYISSPHHAFISILSWVFFLLSRFPIVTDLIHILADCTRMCYFKAYYLIYLIPVYIVVLCMFCGIWYVIIHSREGGEASHGSPTLGKLGDMENGAGVCR